MSASSPNDDDGSQVSDQSSIYEDDGRTSYILRLTPQGKYGIEDVQDWLQEENIEFYVMAKELLPQEHYHLVIVTDVTMEGDLGLKTLRQQVVAFLHLYWPDGQRPRGWGNAQYNLQIADDPHKAVCYALKDKVEYWYQGYDQEYIDQCIAESFKKNAPSNFKLEYKELTDKFHDTDMDIKDFMVLFVQLKAKYGQQVRMYDAYGYALSNLIKRDPAEAENMVESFLYKQ